MWYNKTAYNAQRTLKRVQKNLQKTSEKGLTNEDKCGIINELSDKDGQRKGILKIEQPRIRKPLKIL